MNEKDKLISLLTQYDRRVSARERRPNIHRLPLLFEALDRAFESVADDVSIADALVDEFDADFPPIAKYLNAKLDAKG